MNREPVKVAFKSGNQYLSEKPRRWKRPAGGWDRHLRNALLFDAVLREDGRLEWPWHILPSDPSDGGEALQRYFRRHMFPAGRPELVVVDIVERAE